MASKEYRSPFPDVELQDVDLLGYVFSNPNNCAPDKPIFCDAVTGQSRTYEGVIDRTKRLASGLRRLGVKDGDIVTVFSPNSIDYAIYCFSVLGAGGITSVSSASLTALELRHQLVTAGSVYIIAHSSLYAIASEAAEGTGVRKIILADENGSDHLTTHGLMSTSTPEDLCAISSHRASTRAAFLCFSSGTTGTSKGCVLTHKNLTSNIQQNCAVSEGQYDGSSTFVGFLPFSHAYALSYFVLLGMFSGSTVAVIERFDLELYLQTVEKFRATVLHLVPPIILLLAKNERLSTYDLRNVKRIFSAAAPLSEELRTMVEDRFRRLGIDVDCYQAWGLTETSPLATQVPFKRLDKKHTVGCIVPNMKMRIVDPDTLRDVERPGLPGEIWCKGPNVTPGYYRNKEETKNSFTDGWFRTGDIGKIDAEGYFVILDRIKEMFKYKGLQVIPSELEGKLIGHPYVDDVGVVGIFNDEWASDLPTAFVVLSSAANSKDQKSVITDIHKWVESGLANHKKLRGGVHVIEKIPKTTSGKILRRQLLAEAATKFVKPRL